MYATVSRRICLCEEPHQAAGARRRAVWPGRSEGHGSGSGQKLHDAFKKAYDDPKAIELFERFDFSRIYLSTEDYAKEIPKQYEYKHQNFGAGRTDQELTAAEMLCGARYSSAVYSASATNCRSPHELISSMDWATIPSGVSTHY